MKEATGEVSMTIVTLVAIGVIGMILASNWDKISTYVSELWNPGNGANQEQCVAGGGQWDTNTNSCRRRNP